MEFNEHSEAPQSSDQPSFLRTLTFNWTSKTFQAVP